MSTEILDLYDIALLLNYERASTEPRFRHAKLCEVASATSPFKTIRGFEPQWDRKKTGTKDGFVFFVEEPSSGAQDVPELPSNMLPRSIPAALQSLSSQRLETIYWQTRGHDRCYDSVRLLQHFIDLFSVDIQMRVRTAAGTEFTTLASQRRIMEMTLEEPKVMMVVFVRDSSGRFTSYTHGDEPTMRHAVLGFTAPNETNPSVILDMASLQFGEPGRSRAGTFVLESRESFIQRISRIAMRGEFFKITGWIDHCPDDQWLMQVAKKAKERWDARGEEIWCGQCGAPGKNLKRCARCRAVAYCDVAHQKAAWSFHKYFCMPVPVASGDRNTSTSM